MIEERGIREVPSHQDRLLKGYLTIMESNSNNHVKMLSNTLHARGEGTEDVLTNLFKAYGNWG